ncbi:MAG: hypothetical protein QOG97_2237 [Acidimicrobiaceae bacterium]|nr:hypothetical protein [Acidimicrobiaceae bacterium]
MTDEERAARLAALAARRGRSADRAHGSTAARTYAAPVPQPTSPDQLGTFGTQPITSWPIDPSGMRTIAPDVIDPCGARSISAMALEPAPLEAAASTRTVSAAPSRPARRKTRHRAAGGRIVATVLSVSALLGIVTAFLMNPAHSVAVAALPRLATAATPTTPSIAAGAPPPKANGTSPEPLTSAPTTVATVGAAHKPPVTVPTATPAAIASRTVVTAPRTTQRTASPVPTTARVTVSPVTTVVTTPATSPTTVRVSPPTTTTTGASHP